jgi:hypothetical protein
MRRPRRRMRLIWVTSETSHDGTLSSSNSDFRDSRGRVDRRSRGASAPAEGARCPRDLIAEGAGCWRAETAAVAMGSVTQSRSG